MAAQRWRKLGLLFAADGSRPWLLTHAANPVAEPLGDRVRVYFSSRDGQNRSHVGCFTFDPGRPGQVTDLAERPLVSPGAPGLFDDSGVSIGCVVRDGDRRRLYYAGWNLGVTVPWRNAIGLAETRGDDHDFHKPTRAPVLDRSAVDPFSLSYPWVLQDGGAWRMWYGTNLTWGPAIADMTHVVRHAWSDDGVHWRCDERVVVGLERPGETCIARPCVLRDADRWRMWYAWRGEAYRIGYAESADGLRWERRDDLAGIDVSASGWDAGMVCYPCVFDHQGARWMLYCGNAYGRTGIGLAVLENGP